MIVLTFQEMVAKSIGNLFKWWFKQGLHLDMLLICQNSKTAMAIMKDFVVNVEMVTIGGGDSDSDQDTNNRCFQLY